MLEHRYLRLVRLAGNAVAVGDWSQLAAAVSHGLEEPLAARPAPPGVRIWGVTSAGLEELARHPADGDFAVVRGEELRAAAESSETTGCESGRLMVGLHVNGLSLGVLDVDAEVVGAELLADLAPIVALRASMLGGQASGGVVLAPIVVEESGRTAMLMARFAAEAKRLLEHDRLSAYLLTQDGRAFERFAVATSRTLQGEGVVIPFEDVGLRHIVINNRALVSDELGTDSRIVGREDRVIARAGFHALLSVPLRSNDRPFGVLNFVSRTPGFYSEADIPIAQQIADQVSGFIEHLYVERRMRASFRHETVERERARVAGDIYQIVSRTLPEIESLAGELSEALADNDAESAEKADRVRELARMEVADIRRVASGLAPQLLYAQSLQVAIEQMLAEIEGSGGPATELTVLGDPTNISGAARRAAFRIFQEAVTNARLHAHSNKIEVTVSAGRDLELTVADDGIGFDPMASATLDGLGLQFMREQAERLGGTVTIESDPGDGGTTIRLELLGARAAVDRRRDAEDFDASGPGGPTLRVFIVDQHPVLRAGLLRLVEQSGDMRVVGEAGTLEEARRQLSRLRPDVVLLDAGLGGRPEALIEEATQRFAATSVLVMADSGVARQSALIRAGAAGVAAKSITLPELEDAIRAAAAGRPIPMLSSPDDEGLPDRDLTERERSILGLVTIGKTNAEIGDQLFLATKTVERHVATIARKLGARNRAHAAALAAAEGLAEVARDA